jgi:hypothetical protein
VAEREAADLELGEQRRHVPQHGLAGGGVAVVADGGMPGQPIDDRRIAEIVADMAVAAVIVELLAVVGDDSGRLLAAMLERMQAERRVRRRVRRAIDAEDAALLVELVVVERMGGGRRRQARVSGTLDCHCDDWIKRSRSRRSPGL